MHKDYCLTTISALQTEVICVLSFQVPSINARALLSVQYLITLLWESRYFSRILVYGMKSRYCSNVLTNLFSQTELNKAVAESGPVKSEEIQVDGKKSDIGMINSKHHSLVLEVSKFWCKNIFSPSSFLLFLCFIFFFYFGNFNLHHRLFCYFLSCLLDDC